MERWVTQRLPWESRGGNQYPISIVHTFSLIALILMVPFLRAGQKCYIKSQINPIHPAPAHIVS